MSDLNMIWWSDLRPEHVHLGGSRAPPKSLPHPRWLLGTLGDVTIKHLVPLRGVLAELISYKTGLFAFPYSVAHFTYPSNRTPEP